MSRRVGIAATELAEGVYEHLLTDELARALEAVRSLDRITEPLDPADASAVLGRHIGNVAARVLSGMPVDQAHAVTHKLLEHLASLVDGDIVELIRDQLPAPPSGKLMALYRGAIPERPTSPLATSTLLTRKRLDPTLGHELAREIATADEIDAIIAFVTVGGVRTIQDALHGFARRAAPKLRLLTTTFTGTTDIAALDLFARLPGAEVRVSYDTRRTRLHAKAWLFRRHTGLSTAYIGSANLTSTALGAGQEWMVKVCAADLPHVIDQFAGTFDTLWSEPEFEPYSPADEAQRARLARALSAETSPSAQDSFLVALRALPFQDAMLDRLAAERAIHGRRRNLVVAATGTGKTVVAALDYVRQVAPSGVAPRLLFLAHRVELLDQARKTFRHALQDPSFGELLDGSHTPERWDHVFATIQRAASSHLVERLGADYFRHVVVDECHHVPAASYQAVVPRLRPALLVGLTATPERSDGKSLLPDFDHHIATELRLWRALDDELLVPFEYYGIADHVDLRAVRWSRTGYDAAALGALYTGDTARANLIRHQLARRVADVRQIRALAFCVSIEHATFMAAQFTAAGIPSRAVFGDSPERAHAPGLLRDRTLNVLFTCDLYNEGIDLPFVDTLLLLRPTQSVTLFLQQLGRGLRHHLGKSSCLVLDFIGQHRDEFRFDATLCAITGIPRVQLRKAIEGGFPFLPSGCALQLDAVSREQILTSLRTTLGGARRLVAELRELAAGTGRPALADFLAHTGRSLAEVYDAGGWTTLVRAAGLVALGPGEVAEDVDDLSARLGHLQHIDEPARLRGYRRLLDPSLPARAWTAAERRQLAMLESQLWHRGVLRQPEQLVAHFAARPTVIRELHALCEVLEDRVELAAQIEPVPDWSLGLHCHYSRREIAAGIGYVAAGQKVIALQTGILKLAAQRRELLFVTLDKSGKRFSPTTRYRDYASSPLLFHWETQAAASVHRESGRRYLDSAANGWTFFLFVRTDPEATFAFLGPVAYESHTGDRPIAITWRLATAMPAVLYERYATLRPG